MDPEGQLQEHVDYEVAFTGGRCSRTSLMTSPAPNRNGSRPYGSTGHHPPPGQRQRSEESVLKPRAERTPRRSWGKEASPG